MLSSLLLFISIPSPLLPCDDASKLNSKAASFAKPSLTCFGRGWVVPSPLCNVVSFCNSLSRLWAHLKGLIIYLSVSKVHWHRLGAQVCLNSKQMLLTAGLEEGNTKKVCPAPLMPLSESSQSQNLTTTIRFASTPQYASLPLLEGHKHAPAGSAAVLPTRAPGSPLLPSGVQSWSVGFTGTLFWLAHSGCSLELFCVNVQVAPFLPGTEWSAQWTKQLLPPRWAMGTSCHISELQFPCL